MSRPRIVGRWQGKLRQANRRQRSEEHTSELQSRLHLVCRLLLEKKTADLTMLTFSIRPLLLVHLAVPLDIDGGYPYLSDFFLYACDTLDSVYASYSTGLRLDPW